MSTNPSLFTRVRFLAVALVVALVAASCGGGDESVSSRTRNAGAAPTLEECVALLGLQISPEEEQELFESYQESWARFEERLANWAQHGESVDEQGAVVSQLLARFDSYRGLSPEEINEARRAWQESEEGEAFYEFWMRSAESDQLWAEMMESVTEALY